MDAPPRRGRLPANRWLRWLVYAVAGLLALWALTWAAVPPLLKWQGQKIASEQLGRQVRIGEVDFKPWTLELALDNVTVAGAGGQGTQLAIGRLYADAALASLWRLVPVVDAVRIEQPVLHLRHDGDGHYDIDDILRRLSARPASPEPSEPQRFAIYNIELTGGAIDFDDRTVGRVHQVRQLDLSLPFISNLPDERAVKVVPRLGFVVNGSPFGSTAQALPFTDSLKTDAAFHLARLDLKPYLGYLPAGLLVLGLGIVLNAIEGASSGESAWTSTLELLPRLAWQLPALAVVLAGAAGLHYGVLPRLAPGRELSPGAMARSTPPTAR